MLLFKTIWDNIGNNGYSTYVNYNVLSQKVTIHLTPWSVVKTNVFQMLHSTEKIVPM